ncbi:hypothetical protein [Streptomyces lavendulocolor]|uniref:hypothetical protein n=1 Tax=Streptomyces lavendulocolor TaxID=67316 RepID=UPI003C2D9810
MSIREWEDVMTGKVTVTIEGPSEVIDHLTVALAGVVQFGSVRAVDASGEPLDASISARKAAVGVALVTALLGTAEAGAKLAHELTKKVGENPTISVTINDAKSGECLIIVDPRTDPSDVTALLKGGEEPRSTPAE